MSRSPSPHHRARLAVKVAIVLLPLLYFHRAAFSADVFIARDILRVYYPLKQYWAERVLQGGLPGWYPYNALGQPYAAMVVSGSFHPANLLYLLFPLGLALKLTVLGSSMAALGGTYRFARGWGLGREPALLAGLTYALGGYLVGLTNNLAYLMAAASVPWALWASERFVRRPDARRAALAAGALALVLLSGEPQGFALCCAVVLVLGPLRPRRTPLVRGVARAGLLIGLAALLAMVQLVPVLAVRPEARATAPTLESATIFPFHPLRLLELALGPLFLDPLTHEVASFAMADELLLSGMHGLWVNSVHLGAPALLLLGVALWSHRRRALTWAVAGMALLVLALAMARHVPLYGWLYQGLPLWNAFRSPEKMLPLFLLACALGAGVGLRRVLRSPLAARQAGHAALGLAVLCGLGVLGEWAGRVFSHGLIGALWAAPEAGVQDILRGNVLRGGVAAGVALAMMGGVLRGRLARDSRAWALLLLQFLVLYGANGALYQVSSPDLLEHPPEMLRLIAADMAPHSGRPRVFGTAPELLRPEPVEGLAPIDVQSLHLTETLWPDTPALWGVESVRPYLPVVSRRAMDLLALRQGPLQLPPSRVLNLFGARYLTVSARQYRQLKGNPEVVVAELARFDNLLLRNPLSLPRAYLAAPVCVPDENAALARMFSRDFKPGAQVLLECPAGAASDAEPARQGPPGQVRFARDEPESVVLDVETPGPTTLVLNDAFYSGWSATVDGEPAPILPANVAVRGVRLSAGTHQVVFSYRAPGQGLGALLSLLTLGGLGLALGVQGRVQRRSPPAP